MLEEISLRDMERILRDGGIDPAEVGCLERIKRDLEAIFLMCKQMHEASQTRLCASDAKKFYESLTAHTAQVRKLLNSNHQQKLIINHRSEEIDQAKGNGTLRRVMTYVTREELAEMRLGNLDPKLEIRKDPIISFQKFSDLTHLVEDTTDLLDKLEETVSSLLEQPMLQPKENRSEMADLMAVELLPTWRGTLCQPVTLGKDAPYTHFVVAVLSIFKIPFKSCGAVAKRISEYAEEFDISCPSSVQPCDPVFSPPDPGKVLDPKNGILLTPYQPEKKGNSQAIRVRYATGFW